MLPSCQRSLDEVIQSWYALMKMWRKRTIYAYQNKSFEFFYLNTNALNQSIIFSETRYESDLSSLLAFYSLIIIGYDKDTFSKNAGINQYNLAKKILDYSSSFSNSQMWSPCLSGLDRKASVAKCVLRIEWSAFGQRGTASVVLRQSVPGILW